MNRAAVFHRTYSEYCFALSAETVVIRLRCAQNDMEACLLHCFDRMKAPDTCKTTYKMEKKYSDSLFDYFEAEVTPGYTRLCYYFELFSGGESIFYYDTHFTMQPAKNSQLYYNLHYICKEDIPDVPQWAREAVVYQIFPDSFATSKNHISCRPGEITDENGIVSKTHLGGTLKGIIENIQYLSGLGINCIYMTPVFKAVSCHKYDTVDYREIDPCFGTKDDLKELVSVCHRHRIRVILDGVFNHSGLYFHAFQDVLENGEGSPYKDWFHPYAFPLDPSVPNYECFAYYGHMPKLNLQNPETAQYIIDTACYWIKECDIDGWRLDVANEIYHDFWREFRKAVRSVKADAFIIGEVWDDAHSFLDGDQFDSVMNYNFCWACWDFFGLEKLTARQFSERIQYLLVRYKTQIQQAQINLFDSHDVSRLLSVAGNDRRRLKLAALFLLTQVGIPMIFYGDEKGIEGLREIDYRAPMVWDGIEDDLFNYYKQLIQLRVQNMDAMLGRYETLVEDDDFLAYARRGKECCVIVLINNTAQEIRRDVALPVPVRDSFLSDALNSQHFAVLMEGNSLQVNLEPYSGGIVVI